MELDLLSSRINLNHTCLKIQVSIDDIKTKHPNRTDLINSMEQSLHEIKKAMVVYERLEKELELQDKLTLIYAYKFRTKTGSKRLKKNNRI